MDGLVISKTVYLQGMSCANCEIKIERRLRSLDGIKEVKASFANSTVKIKYDESILNFNKIINSLEAIDYIVEMSIDGNEDGSTFIRQEKTGVVKSDKDKFNKHQIVGIGLIIAAIYMVINNTIGFNFIPEINESMGYGMMFVIGLLTSLHCISMCGGINLSQCVSYKHKDGDPSYKKLMPSLSYNMGRVVSYTVIGGIVGALGSVISFSGAAKGTVSIFAGIFMVIMGLNMLNIFPWLKKLNPRMPKFFGNRVYENQSSRRPFYVGLLNGLMPCGPLQAVQLYALGTGSFMAGALSMFLFSIGTVPLMFGFGAISTMLSSKATKKIFKASGVLVIILGLIMADRGLSLAGYSPFTAIASRIMPSASASVAQINDGYQEVSIDLKSYGYGPIIVQKDVPVRFNIRAEASNINGCNNAIVIPKYDIRMDIKPGDNIVEFTPNEAGNITYTCWMGMISSNIKVVEDITKVTQSDITELEGQDGGSGAGGCCSSGGGGYSSGVSDENIAVAKVSNGKQTVTIDVGDNGFEPGAIVMQKGIETKWILNVKSLTYCNNSLSFPEYNARIQLKEGENIIDFTPEGTFTFSCWMGMLNGYVKVVDDIQNFNMDEVREEIRSYIPASTGGCCGN